MAFLIGGANSAADTAFSVANSCRFNFADGAYLTKTFGASGNQKTFTLSNWIKRSRLGDLVMLYGGAGSDAIYFTTSDELLVICGSGSDDRRQSTMKFRDVGAWYHIVLKFDTTQGTAADRYTLYVNGVEAATPVVSGKNEITEDLDIDLFYDSASYIGFDGSSDYFDGYMAETVHIDGTALAASSFGEFDEDSPTIWKPIDVSGLTFGTNGFYLDYEDSGDLGDDESGNTNDFTETNLAATDQATDTPTNNFATLNGVFNTPLTLAEGNLKATEGSSVWNYIQGTIAVASGKWYWECKCKGDYLILGVIDQDEAKGYAVNDRNPFSSTDISTRGFGYYNGDGKYYSNGSGNTYGDTFASDDIIGVALDCDNKKLYFSKNGTFQDSGDPTSGATGTGAISLNSNTSLFGMAIAVQNNNTEVNFGSPSYANSSDAADANGYGAFEYSPPSGYLSLCTKNLGSDGG